MTRRQAKQNATSRSVRARRKTLRQNLKDLIRQCPGAIRVQADRFLPAYLDGDPDHPDALIEVTEDLDRTAEGQAFVESLRLIGVLDG